MNTLALQSIVFNSGQSVIMFVTNNEFKLDLTPAVANQRQGAWSVVELPNFTQLIVADYRFEEEEVVSKGVLLFASPGQLAYLLGRIKRTFSIEGVTLLRRLEGESQSTWSLEPVCQIWEQQASDSDGPLIHVCLTERGVCVNGRCRRRKADICR